MLQSKLFFTTLEYCEIPNSPTELFRPCIRQLEEEWNLICEAAANHLSNMVWEWKTRLPSVADPLLANRDISFQRRKYRPNQNSFE